MKLLCDTDPQKSTEKLVAWPNSVLTMKKVPGSEPSGPNSQLLQSQQC